MIGRERALEVLASYRDRTIHAIAEARAIGCVTDECGQLADGSWFTIPDEVNQVVDGLCTLLWVLQSTLEKAAAVGPCEHGEIHPYVPAGYDQPPGGAYRCVSCDEVLVEIKCRHCDIELLGHHLAAHLAERCWEA